MLSAGDLLAPRARRVVSVTLPIRGGEVGVRALTAAEVLDISEKLAAADNLKRKLAIQLAAYLSDEAGNSLLTVEGAETFIECSEQADVRAIVGAGVSLNRIDDDAIEAAEKN